MSAIEEPPALMTRAKVKGMLWREGEGFRMHDWPGSEATLNSLDSGKALPSWIHCSSVLELRWNKGKTREYIMCFLDYMGAHYNDQELVNTPHCVPLIRITVLHKFKNKLKMNKPKNRKQEKSKRNRKSGKSQICHEIRSVGLYLGLNYKFEVVS